MRSGGWRRPSTESENCEPLVSRFFRDRISLQSGRARSIINPRQCWPASALKPTGNRQALTDPKPDKGSISPPSIIDPGCEWHPPDRSRLAEESWVSSFRSFPLAVLASRSEPQIGRSSSLRTSGRYLRT